MRKIFVFVVMAFLVAPVVSLAQNSDGSAISIESLNLADIANDSIIVLSKEDSGTAGGYTHTKFAYVHSDCPGGLQVVNYSGGPVDPKDQSLRRSERKLCSQSANDSSTEKD
jgi:hypothetical protein